MCRRAIAEIDELFERQIPAWKWDQTRTYAEEQLSHVVANEEL